MLLMFTAIPAEVDAGLFGYDSVADAFDGGGPGNSGGSFSTTNTSSNNSSSNNSSGGSSNAPETFKVGRETVEVTNSRQSGDQRTGSYTTGGVTYDTYALTPSSGVTHAIARTSNSGGSDSSGPSGEPSCSTPTLCGSAPNFCGQTGPGTRTSCSACTATVPPNTLCTSLPLDPDNALDISPTLVRTGSDVAISWDLGQNYPPNCTLSGKGFESFTFASTDSTGTRSVLVAGPHQYTLECGTSIIRQEVRVLPILYES